MTVRVSVSFSEFTQLLKFLMIRPSWLCRDNLSKSGTFDLLFNKFCAELNDKGLSFNEGKVIDATFAETPRQRNTKEENKQIKEGNGDNLWNPEGGDTDREKQRKLNKKRHKDIDASRIASSCKILLLEPSSN